ncbi:MAG TPA: Maf family nucleotide pyrophosphatase [Steroidobacteraceae bacterium]|nr:Maf family nucleotide pyrophosphatase [Steroidobacteraceae bacterium]
MTPTPQIILASTSAHRRQLLERLRLPFSALAPQVDEAEMAGEAPATRAARLALAKARAVAAMHPGAIVIGSDQVASLRIGTEMVLLHKPGDRTHAHAQLADMAGRTVRFDTGVAVIRDAVELAHVDLTAVQVRPLTHLEIGRYIDREPAFDCAGGFKCEGLGVSLFESVETRDPTALVGLPLIWLCAALRRLGVVV